VLGEDGTPILLGFDGLLSARGIEEVEGFPRDRHSEGPDLYQGAEQALSLVRKLLVRLKALPINKGGQATGPRDGGADGGHSRRRIPLGPGLCSGGSLQKQVRWLARL
jgi:hypothetical protein